MAIKTPFDVINSTIEAHRRNITSCETNIREAKDYIKIKEAKIEEFKTKLKGYTMMVEVLEEFVEAGEETQDGS